MSIRPSSKATKLRRSSNRIAELESDAPGIAAKNDENRASSDPNVAEHADALHLVMQTGVRPGSEDDTGADKKAYGATTLEGRHVTGSGASTALQFVGKKGVSLNLPIADKGVAAMLATRAAAAGPSGQLFPNVSDASLRDYVHGVAGKGVKVKDFRTLVGTSTARAEVAKIPAPKTEAERKKAIMSVAKVVSSKLGNTPTIALQSYIHPNVFESWANG
jgi:DNA topoisomerase-1